MPRHAMPRASGARLCPGLKATPRLRRFVPCRASALALGLSSQMSPDGRHVSVVRRTDSQPWRIAADFARYSRRFALMLVNLVEATAPRCRPGVGSAVLGAFLAASHLCGFQAGPVLGSPANIHGCHSRRRADLGQRCAASLPSKRCGTTRPAWSP